jgi:hypothetical protein
VLSEGYQLYFGAPDEAVDWFSNCLGYAYNPGHDGSVSDWLMDLVSVGFSKQTDFGSRCSLATPLSVSTPVQSEGAHASNHDKQR